MVYRRYRIGLVLFALAVAVALFVYLRTVLPGVSWGDTAEFQRLAYTLGPSHPTGYPLYLLLGHAWITLVPFGSVAGRMNALSSIFAALTVGLVAVTVYKVTGRSIPALAAAFVLAASSSFWSQAVIAEVYALHTLLVMVILLALLRSRKAEASWLPVTAFAIGLGFAHHRMVILLLPGVVAFIVCERLLRDHPIRRLGLMAFAFLVGLCPYALTVYQLKTYFGGKWFTVRDFFSYVLDTGGEYFSFHGIPQHFAREIWPLLQEQMGTVGLILGLLGLVYAFSRLKPRNMGTGLFFGISWLSALGFLTVYRVGDIAAFSPHLQVISACLIGLGIAEILRWLPRLKTARAGHLALQGGLAVALFAMLLVQGRNSWQANDRSEDRSAEERSLAILENVQSDALVVTSWVAAQALRYQQEIEGFRPDLTIVLGDTTELSGVEGFLEENRPVYFAEANGIATEEGPQYSFAFAAPAVFGRSLFQILPPEAWTGLTTYHKVVQHPVTPDVTLESYALTPWPLEADRPARLTVCWSGRTDLPGNYTVLLTIDAEHNWLNREFAANANLDASGCTTEYFVLPAAPFSERPVGTVQIFDREHNLISETSIESIAVTPREDLPVERLMLGQRPTTPLILEGSQLLGLANDAVTSPGISFPVDAYWSASGTEHPRPQAQVLLLDTSGTVVDKQTWRPSPSGSAAAGPISGTVAARVWLQVPRRATPGEYLIQIGAVNGAQMVRAGSIEVEDFQRIWKRPHIPGRAAYEFADGRILLEGFDLTGSPETLNATLFWKSVKPVDENWKVFVHIVDRQGVPVAQNDSFPVDGLRWTDTWKPGEHIVDPHSIALPVLAENTQLRLVVGMYDPQTGVRVPIVGANEGEKALDSVELASFRIADLTTR